MKAAAKATYGRKGDKIVQMNYDAIDAGAKQVVEIEVPESWKDAADEGLAVPHIDENGRKDVVDFVKNIQAKVNAQEGNSLPVSAFTELCRRINTVRIFRIRETWYRGRHPDLAAGQLYPV